MILASEKEVDTINERDHCDIGATVQLLEGIHRRMLAWATTQKVMRLAAMLTDHRLG